MNFTRQDAERLEEGFMSKTIIALRIVVRHVPFIAPEEIDAFPRNRTAKFLCKNRVQASRCPTSGENKRGPAAAFYGSRKELANLSARRPTQRIQAVGNVAFCYW